MRKLYRFFSGADNAEFCQRLSDALAEGYVLYGNPAMVMDKDVRMVGQAAAFTMLNNLQLIDISNNLGDSKSLACHPYTTTHSNMSPEDRASLGISDGHIRVSVGLEDADNLIDDLDQALAFLGVG